MFLSTMHCKEKQGMPNQVEVDWHTQIGQPVLALKLLKTMCSPYSPDYSLNLTEAFGRESCRLKIPIYNVKVRSSTSSYKTVFLTMHESMWNKDERIPLGQGRSWGQMQAKVSLIKTNIFFPRVRGQNWKMSQQFTTLFIITFPSTWPHHYN